MARKGDGIYKRGKVWRLDAFINGKRYQLPLGKGITRAVALELASAMRADILRGEAGIQEHKRKEISFDEAADQFLEWIKANRRKSTWKSCKTHLKALRDSFGGKTLEEIAGNPFLIERHKIKRIKDDCPVALNRELAYLKWMFSKCQEWKKYSGAIPVIKVPKELAGRTRYLTLEEEGRLLSAAREPLRSLIVVGVSTGLRICAEALTLKWIDLDKGYLTIEGAYAKNHETVTLPLNSRALTTLSDLKAMSRGEYVFVNRSGNRLKSIRTAFDTACRHANLIGVTPHVLRHTFASRLGTAGVGDGVIQALGRWKDAKMVARYSHYSEEYKREALEKIVQNSPTLIPIPLEEKTRKSLCARSSVG